MLLTTAWQAYLKDTDLYIGANDTGAHASTGHPCVVVQIAFGMRPVQQGGGGGGGGGGGARPDSTRPPVVLNPQPITTQIAGNLYLDDVILSVAHKYQVNTDWLKERPKL